MGAPKATDFSSEIFDLYPEVDVDIREAAKALPNIVFLSDWWVDQLYG